MLKRLLISVVIASFAISVVAAPQCAGCSGDKDKGKAKAVKAAKVQKAGAKTDGCAMHAGKSDKKAQVKDDCCHMDPFLMEANRMAAAAEGKKSTGCKCKDKAAAAKAKAKVKKAKK